MHVIVLAALGHGWSTQILSLWVLILLLLGKKRNWKKVKAAKSLLVVALITPIPP